MTGPQSRQEPASNQAVVHPSEDAPRSSYGHVPGEELPSAVYVSVLLCFAGLMAASWLLFDRSSEIGLVLLIATVLFTAMLGLPVLLGRMVARRTRPHAPSRPLHTPNVEIYTGTISIGEAWLQILLIPLAMTFAAIAIGIVSLLLT